MSQSLQNLLKIPNLNLTKIHPEGVVLVRVGWWHSWPWRQSPAACLSQWVCLNASTSDARTLAQSVAEGVCLCGSAPGAWPDLFSWLRLLGQGPKATVLWLTIWYVNQTKWLVLIPSTAVHFTVCHCRVFCWLYLIIMSYLTIYRTGEGCPLPRP